MNNDFFDYLILLFPPFQHSKMFATTILRFYEKFRPDKLSNGGPFSTRNGDVLEIEVVVSVFGFFLLFYFFLFNKLINKYIFC